MMIKKFFSIGFVILVVLALCIPVCFADAGAVYLYNSDGDYKIEVLVSDSLSGEYVWKDSSEIGMYLYHPPIVDGNHYTIYCDNIDLYYKAFRIYSCTFRDTIGEEEPGVAVTFSYYNNETINFSSIYGQVYWLRSSGDSNGIKSNSDLFGVSSFNQVTDVYDLTYLCYSIDQNSRLVQSEESFNFNNYYEFTFDVYKPVSSQFFAFDFSYDYENSGSYVLVGTGQAIDNNGEYFGDILSFLSANPVPPVADFVNGYNVTLLLGDSLPRTITPFLSLFVGNNVNSTFKYLVTFVFGMFTLTVILALLRRVKR